MKIEDKLQRILAVLDAKFVAFVSQTGEVISSRTKEHAVFPQNVIRNLIKTIVLTEKEEKARLKEVLCTGLSSRIAIIHMSHGAIDGFLVVGMKEDFDVLAIRGVLQQQFGGRNG